MSTVLEKYHALLSILQTPGYPPLPLALFHLMNLLRSHDRAATFAMLERSANEGIRFTIFITGAFLEKNRVWALRMQSLGCELGLHGYAHLSPNRLSATRFESDLKRCIAAFNQAGIRYRGYRAPNLAFHQDYYSILKKHGIHYSSSLLCSEQRVDPMEKCITFMDIPYILHNPSPEQIIGTLNDYFKPGNILCFHPYGLFAERHWRVLRKLILDTGLQTLTIADNLPKGSGLCLSVDFGV